MFVYPASIANRFLFFIFLFFFCSPFDDYQDQIDQLVEEYDEDEANVAISGEDSQTGVV